MTRKEILNELEEKELPELRDYIFKYIEQHRERWYRLLLKEIFLNPKSVRSSAGGTPLGITGALKNIVDVTPIQERIKDVNGKYGGTYINVNLKRIKVSGDKRTVEYGAPLNTNLGAQQILFYDDKETFLSVQPKMKIKNKWIIFILEEDNIEIVHG